MNKLGNLSIKILSLHSYFTHIATTSAAINNAIDYITHKIFNVILWYSSASLTLKFYENVARLTVLIRLVDESV